MDLYIPEEEFLSAEATLAHALHKFKQEPVKILLVVDDELGYIGVVGERMILTSNLDREKTKVRTLAEHVPRANLSDSIERVAELLIQNRVRKLPVYERDKLVGSISDEKIIHEYLVEEHRNVEAKEIMTEPVIDVEDNYTIRQVQSIFRKNNIQHAPVTKNKNLVGVVANHDIIEITTSSKRRKSQYDLASEKIDIGKGLVKQIMSTPPITVKLNTKVHEIEKIMDDNGINSVIVIQGDEIVGIVTRTDLLKPLLWGTEDDLFIGFKFRSKLPELSLELQEKINSRFEQFAKTYQDLVGHGQLRVNITPIGKMDSKNQLIECNLHLWTRIGIFNASIEEYNPFTAFQEGLDKIKRQIKDKLKKKQDYG